MAMPKGRATNYLNSVMPGGAVPGRRMKASSSANDMLLPPKRRKRPSLPMPTPRQSRARKAYMQFGKG
jgi:hypothetical protein